MDTQVPGTDSSATTALTVELSPPRVEMEPGGTPVEIIATLQNVSNIVEQYAIEVTGLDSDWFTAPVTSVSLFPQDRDQVRISLHPPRRPGLRAGTYPFRVVARALSGTAQQSAGGTLDVRGVAIYRIVDLVPRRLTARGKGSYRLEIANTGAADIRVGFEGSDPEGQCTYGFPKQSEAVVAAGARSEFPVVVKPRKRPWIGPEQSYDFTISARPLDARGEPQAVSGQFTHKPLFRALPIWGIVKWVLIALAALAIIIVLFAVGIPQEFGRRTQVATAQACGSLRNVPVLGAACPRPRELPPLAADCNYQFGFKEFSDAEPDMVGACTTNVIYDDYGNGLQYSKKGVLFWLKESNTVYFFTGDSVYAYVQGKPRLLDGSGRPI
ncbi:MAG TPA: hypothetical protein VF937_06010 [Chloroflexota bacterium]